MKFIKDLAEGDNLNGIYFCKVKNELRSKSDRPYYSMILQDRTGTLDTKVWDVNSHGIEDFDAGDFIFVTGKVNRYQSALQGSLIRARRVMPDEYDISDYLPTSGRSADAMYKELLDCLATVKTPYFKALLDSFFRDQDFRKRFSRHSAAKTVHHSFIGGLLEHTLGVVKLCEMFAKQYPALNHDLLITAAALHDIGKLDEINTFPDNDYTDEGQLLGHIFIGANQVRERAKTIQGFPEKQERELIHCILAHHGELEYGSPKKPSLMEAMALNLADTTDARMQTMTELLAGKPIRGEWYGYNKLFDANIRKSTPSDQ